MVGARSDVLIGRPRQGQATGVRDPRQSLRHRRWNLSEVEDFEAPRGIRLSPMVLGVELSPSERLPAQQEDEKLLLRNGLHQYQLP